MKSKEFNKLPDYRKLEILELQRSFGFTAKVEIVSGAHPMWKELHKQASDRTPYLFRLRIGKDLDFLDGRAFITNAYYKGYPDKFLKIEEWLFDIKS